MGAKQISATPPMDQFYQDLLREDDLGVVILAGIYVDHQLVRLINECVTDAKAIDRMDLSYEQRINLCVALGLDGRFRSPLKTLGTIRNRFAHQLDATLSPTDAKNIYEAMAPEDRRVVQDSYARLKPIRGKRPASFSALDPIERFRLMAVTLHSALEAARRQVTRPHLP